MIRTILYLFLAYIETLAELIRQGREGLKAYSNLVMQRDRLLAQLLELNAFRAEGLIDNGEYTRAKATLVEEIVSVEKKAQQA